MAATSALTFYDLLIEAFKQLVQNRRDPRVVTRLQEWRGSPASAGRVCGLCAGPRLLKKAAVILPVSSVNVTCRGQSLRDAPGHLSGCRSIRVEQKHGKLISTEPRRCINVPAATLQNRT